MFYWVGTLENHAGIGFAVSLV